MCKGKNSVLKTAIHEKEVVSLLKEESSFLRTEEVECEGFCFALFLFFEH